MDGKPIKAREPDADNHGMMRACFKPAESLAASINAISLALAQGKTDDELAVMSAVFTQIGDTLTTIATMRGICENVGKQ